jgi:hypothetical protein
MTKKNILSIILYVFAAFVTFFAIWSLVRTGSLVAAAVSTGQITYAGSMYDIFSVYMASGVQFLIYAFLLAAAGLILQKIEPLVSKCDPRNKKSVKEELAALEEEIEDFEEEIDDFFTRGESRASDRETREY